VWQVVDTIGALLGPLWPDGLDTVLDTAYNVLYLLGQNDCSSIPQHIITLLTGLCE
jgi:hypothetical protein